MRKQAFERRKNALAILVVFFVIISMTATAVSATDEIKHHHSGVQHKSGKHLSEQHKGEKYSDEQYQNGQNRGGKYPSGARLVGARPAIGTPGLAISAIPGLYSMRHMDSRAQLIEHITNDK